MIRSSTCEVEDGPRDEAPDREDVADVEDCEPLFTTSGTTPPQRGCEPEFPSIRSRNGLATLPNTLGGHSVPGWPTLTNSGQSERNW